MASVSTRHRAVKNAQEARHAKKWTMTTNAVIDIASVTKIVVLALRARKPITFKNVAKCAVKFAPEAQLANSNLESGGVLAPMGRKTPMASVSTMYAAVKNAQEARHAKKWTMTTNAVMETASVTKIVVLALRARKPIAM